MRPSPMSHGGLNIKNLTKIESKKLKSEWKKHSPLQIEQFYHTPAPLQMEQFYHRPENEKIKWDAEFYHAYCETFPDKT